MKNKKIFAGLLVAVVLVVGALFANNTNFFRGALVDSILSGPIPEEASEESCERVLKETLLLASDGYLVSQVASEWINFYNDNCDRQIQVNTSNRAISNFVNFNFKELSANNSFADTAIEVMTKFLRPTAGINLGDEVHFLKSVLFVATKLDKEKFISDALVYLDQYFMGNRESFTMLDFEYFASLYIYTNRNQLFTELGFETNATEDSCNLVSELAALSDSEREFLGRLFFERQKRLSTADCSGIAGLAEEFEIVEFEDDED